MFGRKKKAENACDIKDSALYDVGGVPEGSKFYRCPNCDHVWFTRVKPSCPMCGNRDVSECSEYIYEMYKMNQ